jgi:hypothetical protein
MKNDNRVELFNMATVFNRDIVVQQFNQVTQRRQTTELTRQEGQP